MKRALLLLSVLGAAVSAQTTVTTPTVASPIAVDKPFPSGPSRYQQWYSATSMQGVILEPMRFEKVEFFAGPPLATQAALIDCELWLGHGLSFGVTSTFANNFASPPVQVKTRANVALSAAPQGQVCITLPFTTQFTWDRVRPLLLEIRIYGNSLSSQPFLYNFNGTTQGVGSTMRVFAGAAQGGAGAVSGTVQQNWGMISRFTARPGMNLAFGAGCAGEGNITPVGVVQNLAWPGITWTHQITNAPSQRPAVWVIGDTRDAPFPVDLGQLLFGLPPNGCMLRMNPVNAIGLVTVGGGGGGGFASLGVPLPATTNYVGASLFTQWVVFDPLSPNGVLAVTAANWAIVAPVGG